MSPMIHRVQAYDALITFIQRYINRTGLGDEVVNFVWQEGIFLIFHQLFIDVCYPAQ